MVRVKFLIFALLVLALGLVHLAVLSGPMGARAVEGAQAQAASSTAEVVRTLESRRAIARALALRLAASPELVSAVQQLVNAQEQDIRGFASVQSAAEALLPKDIPGVFFAISTPQDAWHARVGQPGNDKVAELDVKALLQAEAPAVVEAFGAPHAFASVPVLWNFVRIPGAEQLETQLAATLVVGVPLLPEGLLDSPAVSAGAAALGLVKEAQVVASGGQAKLVETAVTTLKASQPVVQRGGLQVLGPVKLPVLTTGKDYLGGQAPLVVGTRRELEGTPYEVIALVSTRPLLGTLADYQRNALMGLAGLLGLSLLWTVLMGSSRRQAAAPASGSRDTLGLAGAQASTPGGAPALGAEPVSAMNLGSSPQSLENTLHTPLAEASGLPGGSPDLPFGAAPPPENGYTAPAPEEAFPFPPAPEPQPLQAGAVVPFDPEQGLSPVLPSIEDPAFSTASPRAGAFSFEEIPTAAYTLQQAADPMAAAAATIDSPETTRVATIPRELLQASVRPPTREMPMPFADTYPTAPVPAPGPASVPWAVSPAAGAAVPLPGSSLPGASTFMGNVADAFSEEDYHFQEVFREFVLTRERCGEQADGLTYDKFVQKLRKNKEQLVQKYTCRTVRFQVYVKEGKAALKATPVKD
ncbi:MXAN_5187 family protein [Stigmatella hybrida]|uniref:MXAN_5187 family protein n=1 Tax=Stigmatella hybrida TaxID=394097 RepID=UPI001CDA90A6|nr:MXAN_5187 family protein [Stigmatella hybrida]